MVCAHGVSGLPWVESWLAIRERAGRHAAADQCLLPELLADWSFGSGRMTTSAGYGLLKAVMDRFEVAGRDNMATHSGKATVLSWCAKAGMTKSTRRLLGGHVGPADRSEVTYSRDALAGPMRQLQTLYRNIRLGSFDPDATRSGRWTKVAPAASSGQPAEGPESDSSVSSSSSTSSSSQSSIGNDTKDKKDAAFEGGLWVSARGKAHKSVSLDAPVAKCGAALALGSKWYQSSEEAVFSSLCGRYGCFPVRS